MGFELLAAGIGRQRPITAPRRQGRILGRRRGCPSGAQWTVGRTRRRSAKAYRPARSCSG